MSKRLPVEEVEFKNHLGQTIQPGEAVIIVTTGYSHRVSIKPGVYLGTKNGNVSCRVVEHNTHYRHKETGEDTGPYGWYSDAPKRGYFPSEYPKFDHEKYPHPNRKYNWRDQKGPEYEADMKVYNDAYSAYRAEYDAYNAKVQAAQEHYEAFKVPYDRYTTLQLNRIYKTDTSVFELNV